MSRSNETKSIKLHETCKCICRLNKIICNNKQKWNRDQCRCECKELIDKSACDRGFIFNPRNCKCECYKLCNTSQYLDYLDCKYKKKIIDLIVEKCIEYDDDKTKIVSITVEKVYIILTIVAIVISTVYSIYFVYYNWFLIKNKDSCTKYNTHKENIIW